MDKKLKNIIFIVCGIFLIIIILLFLIAGCSKKDYTALELEDLIISNAKTYYNNHKDELPENNITKTLSLSDLVNLNIIDDLEKILHKGMTCSGELLIENNNNYYMYSPMLNCQYNNETYQSKKLKDTLLENVVTSGNGLYNIYSNYYFRGDNVNNYIIFDGLLWRITKVNNDGTIRLIESNKRNPVAWDNRYNEDTLSNTGINDYVRNNINSRIKDSLDEIYNNEEIISNDAKGFIKPTNLCIGKRSKNDTVNDGSIECSKTLENQYLGLLQVNEYLIASLDENCKITNSPTCANYNYLSSLGSSWSITANSENSSSVFRIGTVVTSSNASSTSMARMVINISENTIVSGNGTKDDPYIVKGLQSELKNIKKY